MTRPYQPIQRIQVGDPHVMRSQEQIRQLTSSMAKDLGPMVPPAVPGWTNLPVAASGTPIGQLINGWLPFGGKFAPPRIWRDGATRRVQLSGLVASGTIGAAITDAIFYLPAGYRPAFPLIFAVASNDLFGSVRIGNYTPTSGCYDVVAIVGSNVYVSLDGISFLAEQ